MKASEKKAWAEENGSLKAPTLRKIIKGLERVREILKKGWCQCANGRTADGEEVEWDDKAAVTWCWNGAVCKVGLNDHTDYIDSAYRAIIDGSSDDSMIDYNDQAGRTRAQVLSMGKKIQGLFQFALDQRSKKGA